MQSVFRSVASDDRLVVGRRSGSLNHHWLQQFDRGRVQALLLMERSHSSGWCNMFLRYLVIALVVFAAYKLDLVSLAATIVGLV